MRDSADPVFFVHAPTIRSELARALADDAGHRLGFAARRDGIASSQREHQVRGSGGGLGHHC
jgi:hypothetical protein